jgi:hypothetical protein
LQSNFCHTHHPQISTISDILELTPSVRPGYCILEIFARQAET